MEKTNHTGKYCRDCKIFTSECDQAARDQIKSILDNPVFSGAKIRIMPDVHAGKGIVIGFTCKVDNYVNPEHVGLDIGCGIDTEIFDRALPEKDYALFEHRLRKEVPMGPDIHKTRQFDMKPFLKFMRSKGVWEMVQDCSVQRRIPFRKRNESIPDGHGHHAGVRQV